ncbi:MAG TPA: thioredoxin domain-containing protein [Natrialbaceae archaeon]|nr:thioredoxin domain-containing protein [Natrialbaceae archaeon]
MADDSLSRRRLLRTSAAATAAGATLGTASLSGCLGLGLFGPSLPSCDGEQITDVSAPPKGQANAPVTVDVYSDYGCGHCADWALEAAPQLGDEIEAGQVRYVHHDFSLSKGSFRVANATRAAYYYDGPEAFWTFNRLAFENQGSLGTETLVDLATEAGASAENVRTAATELPFCRALKDDRQAASDRGVSATPTVFVDDEKLVGPSIDEVESAIADRV